MKKLILSSVLGVALAASTAFGQGYVAFAGAPHTVSDYAGGFPQTDSGFHASFLWNATASTSPMPFATSGTNVGASYSFSAGWAAIEGAGSSGWTVATTGGAGVIGAPANNLGGFSYNLGSAFALDGSTGSGQVIDLYVVAWDTQGGLYSSLASAEAADAPLGWSSVISYTLGSGPPATPPPTTAVPKFEIAPEPTTVALAGLASLSMLILRRRKV